MCERSEKSTSLPEPTGPADEQYVYHLTAAGKQVLEAHEKKSGDRLHGRAARVSAIGKELDAEEQRERRREGVRKARENGHRHGTVSRQYRDGAEAPVPALRIAGAWLRRAGFEVGERYEVAVAEGRLTIERVS